MGENLMFEVVEYRNCDCNTEGCPGEKETVHFQHKDKPPCINFMLKFSDSIFAPTNILCFNNKEKIEIEVCLLNGMVFTRKLRVQEVK